MTEAPPPDPRALRNALGSFLTGVTIVTAVDGEGRPRGFTANSFTSVSLDPPLVLVCPARSAASYEVFRDCRGFAVNVLQDAQKATSTVFASKAPDKFDSVETFSAATGAPIIAGCLGWFDCSPFQRIDAGDHMILVGRVEAFDAIQGQPLGYLRGKYVDLGLESEAIEAGADRSTFIGCLVDYQGKVFLQRGADGAWGIPTAPMGGGGRGHKQRIDEILGRLGLKAEVAFLYAVFEEPTRGQHFIVYRGECGTAQEATDLVSDHGQFFDRDSLPWDQLPAKEFHNMLERYFLERAQARFGVYAEAGSSGNVAQLEQAPRPWSELFEPE